MKRSERLKAWRDLTLVQYRMGWLPDAGGCWVYVRGPGLPEGANRHPHARAWVSCCSVCGRVVIRGEGRWWE